LHWIGFDELSPNGKIQFLPAKFPFALSLSKGHLIKLAHYDQQGFVAGAPERLDFANRRG